MAVNIILKDEAKSKWSGSVKGGSGLSSKPEIEGISPLLYNGEAQAMNIGQKVQTTALLKADNTGLSFGGDFEESYMPRVSTFLSVNPSLAPLTTQRTRLNNSAYGQISNTFHLAEDLQLSIKITSAPRSGGPQERRRGYASRFWWPAMCSAFTSSTQGAS